MGINLATVNLLGLNNGFHYAQKLMGKIIDALKTYCTENCRLFSIYEYQFVYYIKQYTDINELSSFCQALADTLESLLVLERIGAGIGVVEINRFYKTAVDKILTNLMFASERAINTYEKDIGVCFFNEDMEEQIIRQEVVSRELIQIAAGENADRLFLHFQPILDLKSNQICCFEALARLQSDIYGFISPLEFIPLAEKTKLIVPLGQKIIIQALNFLKILEKSGWDNVGVSINISAIQLLRNNFVETFLSIINKIHVNPQNIAIEITESTFTSNYIYVNSILGRLNDYGIRIAIDDFGTGYSSLARERELNINCLKIDRHFINKLLYINPEKAITAEIIKMAHKLGHCVIAEGVEHEKQLQYLKNHGCDKAQGFFIGKPLAQEQAIELLNKQK